MNNKYFVYFFSELLYFQLLCCINKFFYRQIVQPQIITIDTQATNFFHSTCISSRSKWKKDGAQSLKKFDSYQTIVECKYSHISPMMNVVSSHDRIGKILNPYTSQSIPTYFIVFIRSLSIICHIQTNIFTITYITVSYCWVCTCSAHTNCSTNWKKKLRNAEEMK